MQGDEQLLARVKQARAQLDLGIATEAQAVLDIIITGLSKERPPRSWEPAASARARAESNAQLIDVDLHIDRYIVRCRERGNSPSNAEWLRWFMDDEQTARIQSRRDSQDHGVDNTGVPSTWH